MILDRLLPPKKDEESITDICSHPSIFVKVSLLVSTCLKHIATDVHIYACASLSNMWSRRQAILFELGFAGGDKVLYIRRAAGVLPWARYCNTAAAADQSGPDVIRPFLSDCAAGRPRRVKYVLDQKVLTQTMLNLYPV